MPIISNFNHSALMKLARRDPLKALEELIEYVPNKTNRNTRIINTNNSNNSNNTSNIKPETLFDVYLQTFRDQYLNELERPLVENDVVFMERFVNASKNHVTKINTAWNSIYNQPKVRMLMLKTVLKQNPKGIDISYLFASYINEQIHEKQNPYPKAVVEIANELLKAGADMFAEYKLYRKGMCSGLDAACMNAHLPLIKFLVERIDKHHPNYQFIIDNCLCSVCFYGPDSFIIEADYISICKFLIQHGANPTDPLPTYDGNAIELAEEKQEFGGFGEDDVVQFLKTAKTRGNTQNTAKFTDLPVGVLSKFLNVKSTRALKSTSKLVRDAIGYTKEQTFAIHLFGNDNDKKITCTYTAAKTGSMFPYNTPLPTVVIRFNDKDDAGFLGFEGLIYVFAHLHLPSKFGTTLYPCLRLVDVKVMLPYGNHFIFHRNVRQNGQFTNLMDKVSRSSADASQMAFESRFHSGDKYYKAVILAGYYKALEKIERFINISQTNNNTIKDECRTADGLEMKAIMDSFSSQKKLSNNAKTKAQTQAQTQTQIDYALQNARRKTRNRILGNYQDRLGAPLGTRQAIATFLPANAQQTKPKGNVITRIIREKASDLQRSAFQANTRIREQKRAITKE